MSARRTLPESRCLSIRNIPKFNKKPREGKVGWRVGASGQREKAVILALYRTGTYSSLRRVRSKSVPRFYEEHTFDRAEEFLGAFTPWTSDFQLDGYIFRGHSDDSYSLRPSALRPEAEATFWSQSPIHKPVAGQAEWEYWHAEAERQLIREFYRLADARGLHVPLSPSVREHLAQTIDWGFQRRFGQQDWIPDDLLEAAALAQHYGIPTRLLDWTYDPLVSIYFATDTDLDHSGHLCIWCLNHDQLSVLRGSELDSPLRFIRPHYSGNPNLAAQAGLFTHWGSTIMSPVEMLHNDGLVLVDRTALDERLRLRYAPKTEEFSFIVFQKFRLPWSERRRLRQLLAKAGYDTSRIYPGYASVAREVLQRNGFIQRSTTHALKT